MIERVPEVSDYEVYAGTSAPINFNGLVRQYYLRQSPELGDIQVNLVDKRHRQPQEPCDRARGQARAGADRAPLPRFDPGRRSAAGAAGARPDRRRGLWAAICRAATAWRKLIRTVFEPTPDIVDVDDSVEAPSPRLIVEVDRQKAALLGVSQAADRAGAAASGCRAPT